MVQPTVLQAAPGRTLAVPVCSQGRQPAQPRHGALQPAPARRAARAPQVAASKQEQSVDEPPTIEKATTEKVTSLDSLSTLASKLLMNAASLRVVRKETFCVHCRGTGKETCTACQGSGIVQNEEALRMNTVKHAAGKFKVLLGMESPKMRDGDWQRSNRCRRCHGSGALPCKYCDGAGRLGPAQ